MAQLEDAIERVIEQFDVDVTLAQVLQEVERAVHRGLPIMPFRIEDVEIVPALELFIGARHWLDALSSRMERHLQELAVAIEQLLEATDRSGDREAARAPEPAGPPARGRRRLVLGAGLVALVAAGLALGWMLVAGGGDGSTVEATVSDAEVGGDSVGSPPEDPPAPGGDGKAREQELLAAALTAEREALTRELAPGSTYRLLCSGSGRPAVSVRWTVLQSSTANDYVLALLDHETDPMVRVVYAGSIIEKDPSTADGVAAEHVVLRAAPVKSSLPGPLGSSTVELWRGGGGLVGRADRMKLSAMKAPDASAPPPTADLEQAHRSAVSPGSRWVGAVTRAGVATTRVSFHVARNALDGGDLRFVGTPEGDPFRPLVYAGALQRDPEALLGWPVVLTEVEDQFRVSHEKLLGAGSGSTLRLRWTGAGLAGVCGDSSVVLTRQRPDRSRTSSLLSQAIVAGARFHGTAHRPGRAARRVVLCWTEVAPDGGSVLATVEAEDDPGILVALAGSVFGPEPAQHDSWPVLLRRGALDVHRSVEESRLLGVDDVELRLRPLPDGRLVGWCRDEQVDLVPTDPVDSSVPLHGEAAAARLLGACSPEVLWRGTARYRDAPALPIELRFLERGERGERLVAAVTSPDQPGIEAVLEGTLSLERESLHAWAFTLKRVKEIHPHAGGRILGPKRTELALRLDDDGRMIGWCYDERIELSPSGGGADGGPGEPDAKGEGRFWALLEQLDGHLDAQDPASAEDVFEELEAIVPQGREYSALLGLREGRLLFERGRAEGSKGAANSLYLKAEKVFGEVHRGKTEARDHHDVSVRAAATFPLFYTQASLFFTTRRDSYGKRAVATYESLREAFGNEKDRSGRLWVDRANEYGDKVSAGLGGKR